MNATLNEIASAIGHAGARALCSLHGGQVLYVAQSPVAGSPLGPGSMLAECIGTIMLARLVERYAGQSLYVPQPPTAAAVEVHVRTLWADAYTTRQIAELVGLSERRIRQIVEL